MKIVGLISLLVICLTANLNAQEKDSLNNRSAQVTFAYPIGSNGVNAMNYSNSFSFNILYGLNGGVNGVEIGSILNYNKGSVKGFQLSGVTNLNKGASNGFLLSGVSNICLDTSSGAFISGVLNYAKLNAKGVQLAPINIAASDYAGFQLGFVNYAKKHKGVQLGVINIMQDGENGIPIGIINIVKNGLFEFELTGGEVIYSNLNYKMGVDKFYTIYKLGYASYKDNSVYSYGLGFGSNVYATEKHSISIDLSGSQIVYDNNWDDDINLLNKLDFNYKYKFSNKFSLLVGPSFNVYYTEVKTDGEFGTLDIPYTIHTSEKTDSKTSIWIGLNVGLSLKL